MRIARWVAGLFGIPKMVDRLGCTLKENLNIDSNEIAGNKHDIGPPANPEPPHSE